MSNVAISGNASGTGTLTIAAPNTNSNYTINLPTITGGSFIVSDASDNVVIGTTSSTSYKLAIQSNNSNLYLKQTTGDYGSIIGQRDDDGSLTFSRRDLSTVTERMRIDASGNLLVGTTSSPTISGVPSNSAIVNSGTGGNWALGVANSAASGGARGVAVNYSAQTPNNTQSEPFFFNDSTAYRFRVVSNGGIYNYQANNSNLSDRREKTNFAPAKSYLDVICAIPVQTFNYIDQNRQEDDGLTLGVVAQDVQEVAPELVTETNWGTEENPKMRLSIYQTDMQYALMKCIQEQQALITQLQADVAALKGRA